MRIETFGQLLEKLLYLSNQKKSSLAKYLGYDISYISKWINERNVPTQKNIPNICKMSAEFIVGSLNENTSKELRNYFEIEENNNENNHHEKVLMQYVERSLKEAYGNTTKKTAPKLYKNTYSEEYYNGLVHVNPSLRKKYLSRDVVMYANKTGNLDIIISANIYKLNQDDKMSIINLKEELKEIQETTNVRVRMIVGLEENSENLLIDTMSILNMITSKTNISFEMYHGDLNPNAIISVIKNRIFHSAIFNKDGNSIFTTMSKEKDVVDDMYYSLENTIKNRVLDVVELKSAEEMIKNKQYVSYIMGQDLKLLIGDMNELFMPPELFKDISEKIFGHDEDLMKELNQINAFLNKVTYKSKMKVLIYEEELKRYISTGVLRFFNHTVKLDFKQVESHINNIKRIVEESDTITIKLIEGRFTQNFKKEWCPSMYLSKGFKMTKSEPKEGENNYLLIKDNVFKRSCEKTFDEMWMLQNERIVQNLEDIEDRLEKLLCYTRVVNDMLDA